MTIDQRIAKLEKVWGKGTSISRQLAENGYRWCIGLGQMQDPKTWFTGKTIEQCLKKAERFKIIER